MIFCEINRQTTYAQQKGISGVEQFKQALNMLFAEVYHNVLRLEIQAIQQSGRLKLSINEMHLIECVGRGMPEGYTIRELAEELQIKSPSVTVAVQKLVAKGYVEKVACLRDRRAVRVLLTWAGRRVEAFHAYYHRMLVRTLAEGMEDDEQRALLRAVKKLNAYLVESLGGSKE